MKTQREGGWSRLMEFEWNDTLEGLILLAMRYADCIPGERSPGLVARYCPLGVAVFLRYWYLDEKKDVLVLVDVLSRSIRARKFWSCCTLRSTRGSGVVEVLSTSTWASPVMIHEEVLFRPCC